MYRLIYLTFFFVYQFHTVLLTQPSVIIIGAGPAGIAAATKLLENSFTNIKILEAENRIGGRINSVKFGDAFIELGAEYCHGEKGNIVYDLVKDLNLLEEQEPDFGNIYYSNGTKLEGHLVEDMTSNILNYHDSDIDFNVTSLSLEDIFLERYNTTVLSKYENNHQKLKILKEGVLMAEGLVIVAEGAFSWKDVSAVNDYSVCKGHQTLKWKDHGYKIILDILMKKYPNPSNKLPIDDKIHLNQKVREIKWNENGNVIVKTMDKTYTADHVIFTPSIGVLKKHKKTLFNPPLPISKINAIDSIGFGGVIKAFMHFPQRWWKNDDTMFILLWSEEDLKTADFKPKKNGIPWIAQIRVLLIVPHNPNVLGMWITGDLVEEIEKLPRETITEGFQFVLNKFLGKSYNVTEFDDFLMSRWWYSNDNFRGVYSFTKTGYYKKDLSYPAKLAEPLLNNATGLPALLFAGEASNPTHFSTVHGAIETGRREAERIIKLHS